MVSLIVFTAVIGMFLAAPGMVPLQLLLAGTLGIALVAGSAAAIGKAPGELACIAISNHLATASGDRKTRPRIQRNNGTATSVIVLSSLISTCSDGPAVSLNGSPTVSPTTPAL